jgi:hypothetical protein
MITLPGQMTLRFGTRDLTAAEQRFIDAARDLTAAFRDLPENTGLENLESLYMLGEQIRGLAYYFHDDEDPLNSALREATDHTRTRDMTTTEWYNGRNDDDQHTRFFLPPDNGDTTCLHSCK